MKISNGNISVLNNTDDNKSFTVSNSGTVYRGYSGNGNYISESSYSFSYNIYDIDYSDSENKMYMWQHDGGGKITYWDFNNSTETILFDPDDSFQSSTAYMEQVVRYNDGLVYFNEAMSLFSVDNNGNNSRIITSSTDD